MQKVSRGFRASVGHHFRCYRKCRSMITRVISVEFGKCYQATGKTANCVFVSFTNSVLLYLLAISFQLSVERSLYVLKWNMPAVYLKLYHVGSKDWKLLIWNGFVLRAGRWAIGLVGLESFIARSTPVLYISAYENVLNAKYGLTKFWLNNSLVGNCARKDTQLKVN